MPIPRTYKLSQDVINRIDELAEQLDVTQSSLVEYLLSQGLQQVVDGILNIPIERKPHDGVADALCLSEYGMRTYIK